MERTIAGEEATAMNRGESSGAGEGEQVIRWERFLPRRSLRVLLVENDDSTRHIVAALLRKCSYQVTAVADGLKAWQFLMEKSSNFDLVLAEVMMPSFSGIGLLSKIMNNEIFKNIPVIMMSSQDSIGIVFKCMLKGAADFLVKPVRKNELRNLWQHVWRKYCASSCGNKSENQIRFEGVSDNGVNIHRSQNVDNKSIMRNSAERESDTQSTCSKPDTETRHERAQSDSDPAMVAATSSMHGGVKQKGTEVKVTLSVQAAMSTEKIHKNSSADGSPSVDGDSFSLRCKKDANFGSESFCRSSARNEPSREFIDFIGTIASGQCSHGVLEYNSSRKDAFCEAENNSCRKDVLHGEAETSGANKGACDLRCSPLWKLSLERSQVNSLDENGFRERQILKHSEGSAFSRYGSAGRLSCPKAGSSHPNNRIKTSEFVVDYNPESGSDGIRNGQSFPLSIKRRLASATSKEETYPFVAGPSKEYAYVCHSSTQEAVFSCPQLGALPLPVPDGAIPSQHMRAGHGAILQPVFYPESSFSCGPVSIQNAIEVHGDSFTNHFHGQSFNQHCIPQQLQQVKDQMVDEEPADPHFVLHATEKANESGSYQSNHNGNGSNRSNGDTNAAVNVGAALERGNEDGFQNCNGQGLNQDHARREAALTKFRLKRKDRCFEKKVRYHSRKKLAEQRPRLKGQFVRRAVVESSTTGSETDD